MRNANKILRENIGKTNLELFQTIRKPCQIGAGWGLRSGWEVSRAVNPLPPIPQACGRQLSAKRCPPLASMSGARQQKRANTPARDESTQQEEHAKRGQL
jgi:hypothetical protein